MAEKQKPLIAPSLLSSDFCDLKNELTKLQSADMLHLDIMDCHFVPNLTFGFPVIDAIRKRTQTPLDAHLMVDNPAEYIDQLARIGVEYISFHLEASVHAHRLLAKIKSHGIKAGIAINPGTAVCLLEPLLAEVDFVLLMSVNPGFGGQSFLPLVYDKLEYLTPYKKKYNFQIQVDGGVCADNARQLVKAGVDILVAGSFVFNGDYSQNISTLRG